MFSRSKGSRDERDPGIRYDTSASGPIYPMQLYNELLVPKTNRQAPSSDVDRTPREFRRMMGDVSGVSNVQQFNGLQRYTAYGYRFPYVDYLYAAAPIIPGQDRDDYAGKIKSGIGPLEYQDIFRQGPGSQPQAPGGVRQIASPHLFNPGTS